MYLQKTSFQGLSLVEAKRGVSDSFLGVGENKNGSSSSIARRRLEITAKTAGASKTIEAEVDKPLGLTLGQKPTGGVVITVSIYLSPFLTNSIKTVFGFSRIDSTKITYGKHELK